MAALIVSAKIMATYTPSFRGISAVVLAVFAGFVLPRLGSPHGGPIPSHIWIVGSLLLLLAVAASAVALFSRKVADKILGFLGGVLTVWLIYAFFR